MRWLDAEDLPKIWLTISVNAWRISHTHTLDADLCHGTDIPSKTHRCGLNPCTAVYTFHPNLIVKSVVMLPGIGLVLSLRLYLKG